MPISQFFLSNSEQQRLQRRTRGLCLVRIRYYYIGLLGIVAVATGIAARVSADQLISYAGISVIGLITNTIIGIILRSPNRAPIAYTIGTYAAIILDIWLATSVVYILGGYPARATLLYAVPILSAGVLLLQPSAYVAAGLSTIAYDGVLIVQHLLNDQPEAFSDLFAPMFFYPVAFFILAAIVTRFSAANAINKQEVSYTQMLGLVRQQLKQPMSAIDSTIQAIENDPSYGNLSQEQQRLIKQLGEESVQLNTSVTHLISAADTDQEYKNKAETVDMSNLARSAAQNCALSVARLADLHLNIKDNITVVADSKQLHTAIYNILDNAFRYSEIGKPVDLELTTDKGSAVLVITDQGRGMSNEQQKTVASRQEQLENNRQSTPEQFTSIGLGLHTSKLIVERFGGKLDIFSKAHIGTKVTITLPLK
jgi:signal transduction histidine kinase